MMKLLLFALFLIFVIAVGLPQYLGPDDLAKCEEGPAAGTCASADAIVVVSGGDTNARVQEGVRLFKLGWSKQMIFSGAAADQTGLSNALAMKQYAMKLGVDESFISIEEFSRTTAENAANTARYIQQNNLSRIILVTSAYHQRRASLEFGSRLGESVLVINHPVASDRQWSRYYWWLTPTGWWLAGGELAKIVLFYVVPESIV
ncbi:MAG: YdcF family protein [Candidatus Saccharimonadales bacterium]